MTRIPLSRSHLDTAWPIAVFHVMNKPAGAACNMACEYCFYRHHQDQRHEGTEPPRHEGIAEGAMSDEALERFIADYLQSQDNPTVFFT